MGTNGDPRGSIDPVGQTQARHLPKMLEIARDQNGVMGESDTGDEQVAAADFLQALETAELLEDGRQIQRDVLSSIGNHFCFLERIQVAG